MFDIESRKHFSSKELEENYKEFCPYCWGNGYGDCIVCKQRYEEELKRRSENNG